MQSFMSFLRKMWSFLLQGKSAEREGSSFSWQTPHGCCRECFAHDFPPCVFFILWKRFEEALSKPASLGFPRGSLHLLSLHGRCGKSLCSQGSIHICSSTEYPGTSFYQETCWIQHLTHKKGNLLRNQNAARMGGGEEEALQIKQYSNWLNLASWFLWYVFMEPKMTAFFFCSQRPWSQGKILSALRMKEAGRNNLEVWSEF